MGKFLGSFKARLALAVGAAGAASVMAVIVLPMAFGTFADQKTNTGHAASLRTLLVSHSEGWRQCTAATSRRTTVSEGDRRGRVVGGHARSGRRWFTWTRSSRFVATRASSPIAVEASQSAAVETEAAEGGAKGAAGPCRRSEATAA